MNGRISGECFRHTFIIFFFIDVDFVLFNGSVLGDAKRAVEESVEAFREVSWVLQRVAGVNERTFVENGCEFFGLRIRIVLDTFEEFLDRGMRRVDFKDLLLVSLGVLSVLIRVCLSLRDTFHLSGVAVLVGDDNARILVKSLGDSNFIEVRAENLLPPGGERLEDLLDSFVALSIRLVVFRELEVALADVNELLLAVLVQVLESELIDRVVEK